MPPWRQRRAFGLRPYLPQDLLQYHNAWTEGVAIVGDDPLREKDCLLEGTGFELPVRGRGQSGCRPFYAAECSGRVGAPSQFSDSTTPCIKAAWTRPPRPQSVPATHSAEFCLVREENGNALPGDRARRSRPGARQPLVRSEGAAAGPPSSPSGNPIWSVSISTHSMAFSGSAPPTVAGGPGFCGT